ncbi:hypothetical protein QVD17_16880 [Tagetes erecta]|uniref:Uncharacterized protein n=1 Tax=Tagetes erecta TaxID=13708 RepID=A0AAD8KS62_TARER|nr:hypothetical protein QVD17_16880 [Tagetes erecta]
MVAVVVIADLRIRVAYVITETDFVPVVGNVVKLGCDEVTLIHNDSSVGVANFPFIRTFIHTHQTLNRHVTNPRSNSLRSPSPCFFIFQIQGFIFNRPNHLKYG